MRACQSPPVRPFQEISGATRAQDHIGFEPSPKTIIRDLAHLRRAWFRLLAGVLAERSLTFLGLEPFKAMTYRAFCFFIGCFFFGRRCVAPDRFVFAIAPCAWAIECMHAELINSLHFMNPIRVHPVGVVMSRF